MAEGITAGSGHDPRLVADEALPERPDVFVQSLERGLAVIRAFSRDQARLSLTEVAKITGMTRAAARRYLLTLQYLGYVGCDGRQFHLKPSVLQLGYSYLSSLSLAEVAQQYLVDLAESLHESASVSVLEGEDVVYIARASTARVMSISLTVGARLPAYCTSMGRVLLAALSDEKLDAYLATAKLEKLTPYTIADADALRAQLEIVRGQGYCILDQELEDGVRSVAVPLRDASGVVGAMNVSSSAARVPLWKLRTDYLKGAQETAGKINDALGARRL